MKLREQSWRGAMALACGLALVLAAATAQPQGGRPGGQGSRNRQDDDEERQPPPRPTDPRLIEIHKDFLTKAEKLATEYERKKELDKAREVYSAILRLVPEYPLADKALQRLQQEEATTDKKVLDVFADKDWQDTGVTIVEGRPVIIEAAGEWTFQMTYKLGPDGIDIPQELRSFNLGCLVGVIASPGAEQDAKPFFIGASTRFIAENSGQLYLRMYDGDPKDNDGKLQVSIQSTFAKPPK
jgi:hypothetical protein